MNRPGVLSQGSVGPTPNRASLMQLAVLFLQLGLTAFGGPAAHIAMMQEELVERRRWLTKEQFFDLFGAANLLPGPSSTELAIYTGYGQAGWVGLFLAGSCFILPASLIVTGLAWAYVRFGHLPQITGILYGVKPVVIAIVFQALWNLSRTLHNYYGPNGTWWKVDVEKQAAASGSGLSAGAAPSAYSALMAEAPSRRVCDSRTCFFGRHRPHGISPGAPSRKTK